MNLINRINEALRHLNEASSYTLEDALEEFNLKNVTPTDKRWNEAYTAALQGVDKANRPGDYYYVKKLDKANRTETLLVVDDPNAVHTETRDEPQGNKNDKIFKGTEAITELTVDKMAVKEVPLTSRLDATLFPEGKAKDLVDALNNVIAADYDKLKKDTRAGTEETADSNPISKALTNVINKELLKKNSPSNYVFTIIKADDTLTDNKKASEMEKANAVLSLYWLAYSSGSGLADAGDSNNVIGIFLTPCLKEVKASLGTKRELVDMECWTVLKAMVDGKKLYPSFTPNSTTFSYIYNLYFSDRISEENLSGIKMFWGAALFQQSLYANKYNDIVELMKIYSNIINEYSIASTRVKTFVAVKDGNATQLARHLMMQNSDDKLISELLLSDNPENEVSVDSIKVEPITSDTIANYTFRTLSEVKQLLPKITTDEVKGGEGEESMGLQYTLITKEGVEAKLSTNNYSKDDDYRGTLVSDLSINKGDKIKLVLEEESLDIDENSILDNKYPDLFPLLYAALDDTNKAFFIPDGAGYKTAKNIIIKKLVFDHISGSKAPFKIANGNVIIKEGEGVQSPNANSASIDTGTSEEDDSEEEGTPMDISDLGKEIE